MTIGAYELVQTCAGYPEQYDVFLGERRVGYLRLRHGYFTAQHENVDGPVVFSAEPNGYGYFEDDERDEYLRLAVAAIDEKEKGGK